MIHSLKPYPSYKPSGVEWLGEVPAHWEVRRLKHVCCLMYGDALPTDVRQEGTVPVYGSNGRVGLHSVANTKAPCVIVGRKGSFGKVNFSPEAVFAIDTTFFVDRRFTSTQLRWLFYVLGWLRLDEVSKDSAVPGLDREDAYQRLSAVPPLPEQTAIARFLDYVDRKIRRFIRAKRKLIGLLEEQKQALIHQAVTGAVDVRTGRPYPSYKPSGVEWLGQVPTHWRVNRLKQLTAGPLKYGANVAAEFTDKSWPRYIRITDFEPSGALRDDTFRSLPPDVASEYAVQTGDVLLARSGATVGKAFLVGADAGPACHAGYLIRVRPDREKLLGEFLFSFCQSCAFREWRSSILIMATIENISAEKYANLCIPVPPLEEQEAIVMWLCARNERIDEVIRKKQHSLQLIDELRTRLIADVVTGKVDVREAAARLPDDEEEAEPDDAFVEEGSDMPGAEAEPETENASV